jgi:peroxiredoxin
VAIGTGDRAPDFDLEDAHGKRVRLSDFLGRTNVLLVFHPFAWTGICTEEALDLQANLDTFRAAETEVVLVACDPAPSRQAWKEHVGAEYQMPSDFWAHGAAARAYGVLNDATGAPLRGTFLIDKEGTVIWSLVNEPSVRREELVPAPLATLGERR